MAPSAPAAGSLRFDAQYAEQVSLRDGSTVWLRLVQPGDTNIVAAGFEALSPLSRQRRFLSDRTALLPGELSYLTQLDQRDHFAIAALRSLPGQPGDGLGIARFIRLRDRPTVAEAAVVVVDSAQRLGLGRALLLRLAAAARERGIERFYCEVLETNLPIQNLLQDLLPQTLGTESGVLSVEIPIPDRPLDPPGAVTWLPSLPSLPSLLERFLSAAAAGLVVVRRAVERFGPHFPDAHG